ncbi:exosortase C-terminal domain/associated protein EpsI [Phenylobacterium sp.]|uniref:exosortase C-terminal domain/associated protein EpsI n=1 Tax=Phenylobacterium sp. TaxID=1871053 RepID=UPI0037CA266A
MTGLGLSALGAAEALRPRSKLKLLKAGGSIEAALPREFGPWVSHEANLVNPAQAGRLAQGLYSETVQRAYFNETTGDEVFVLAAYGDTQSDLLQLHRPESCYPAVGFELKMSEATQIPLGRNRIPGRRVIATMETHSENIIYWTRLGERLPQSAGDQRDARLLNAIDGFVADGILLRCSAIGEAPPAFALLERFIPQLLSATPRDLRPALVGTDLARRIA